MKAHQLFFNHLLSYQQLTILLLVSLALGISYIAYQVNWHSDFTQNKRNTVSEQTRQVLDGMPEIIEIKAVVGENQTNGKYFKKSIQLFLAKYQRHKKNIQISFLAPERDMNEIRKLGLKQEGDWIVKYNNQHEFFSLPYTEESFTNLLIKIQSVHSTAFFFTEGHLEPQLNDTSLNGLQQLAEKLNANGLKTKQSLQLSDLSNGDTLVINAPKKAFSSPEKILVEQHIHHGGNVIWLVDSQNLNGLNEIAENLGIEISSGIVVDLSNEASGLDSRLVAASNYASHEIFSDFSLRSFFMSARRVSQRDNKPNVWRVQNLIGVAENGWLTKSEPKILSKEALSNNILKSGPINIAVALRRQFNKQEQRIMVIGNGQFLTNQYIAIGGNQLLATRLFKWSSMKYTPLSIQQNITKDAVVVINNENNDKYWILGIFNGFQFLIPFLLLLTALFTWYRRTRP